MAPKSQNSWIHIKNPHKDPGFLNQVPAFEYFRLTALQQLGMESEMGRQGLGTRI